MYSFVELDIQAMVVTIGRLFCSWACIMHMSLGPGRPGGYLGDYGGMGWAQFFAPGWGLAQEIVSESI